jgi:ribosomal-protein-serine acetyltransferase
MILQIDNNLRLELTAERHAAPLYEVLDNERKRLSEFLPWIDEMKTVAVFTRYIKNCELLYEQKKEVSFIMIADETPVGRIGLHHLNLQNKMGAIGYWITRNAEGKGVVTRSCKKIISHGFNNLGLHRIECKVATTNFKSQAIPEKLHFKKEGILRDAEWVNNKYNDLFLYSLLSYEWGHEENEQ